MKCNFVFTSFGYLIADQNKMLKQVEHVAPDKSPKPQEEERLMTFVGKQVSLIDLKSKVPLDRFTI